MIEVLGLVDDSCRARHAAIVVDEDIAHDGEDPTLEVGVLGVLLGVVESLEHGVLEEILGVIAVGGEHEREVEKVGLKTHELVLECRGSHC